MLEHLGLPIQAVKSTELDGVFILNTSFKQADGTPLSIYYAKPKSAKVWFLSDGNSLMTSLQGTNMVLRPGVLKQLVNSYGLKLSDTLMVFDDSEEELPKRVSRFIQCANAIDGVVRMWQLTAPVRIDAPREGETNVDDAALQRCPDAVRGSKSGKAKGHARVASNRKGSAVSAKRKVSRVRKAKR
jgi:hypothetical protein